MAKDVTTAAEAIGLISSAVAGPDGTWVSLDQMTAQVCDIISAIDRELLPLASSRATRVEAINAAAAFIRIRRPPGPLFS